MGCPVPDSRLTHALPSPTGKTYLPLSRDNVQKPLKRLGTSQVPASTELPQGQKLVYSNYSDE